MQYQHTQTAPLYWLLVAVAAGFLVAGWFVVELPVQVILMGSGGLMLLLAFGFRDLSVTDEGDRLLVSFGPLPIFRRRICYADVASAERSRTSVLDGWGIHLSPSGGWTWNLWGFDCVDVYFKSGRKLRIGTDDAAGLEAFLKRRVGDQIPG